MTLALLTCRLPLVNANTFFPAPAPDSLVSRRASFKEMACRAKSTVTPDVALEFMVIPAESKAMAWSKEAVPAALMSLSSILLRACLAFVIARAVATEALPDTLVMPALPIAKACVSERVVVAVRVRAVLLVLINPASVLALVSKPRPIRLKTSDAVMVVLEVVCGPPERLI